MYFSRWYAKNAYHRLISCHRSAVRNHKILSMTEMELRLRSRLDTAERYLEISRGYTFFVYPRKTAQAEIRTPQGVRVSSHPFRVRS